MPASLLADHCVLWLNDTSYSKVSEELNRKFPNFQSHMLTLSTTVYSVTDRQTDEIIMPRADYTVGSTIG